MILPQRGKDGGLYNSAKQESAKHGACENRLSSRAHIPDGTRPNAQLPPFLGLRVLVGNRSIKVKAPVYAL